MKKHFIVTTVIIDTLILIMFLLGTGIYTYFRATDEMNSLYKQVEFTSEFPEMWLDGLDGRSLIMESCNTIWGGNGLGPRYRLDGTGYYGFIKLSDGTIIDTSSDFGVLRILADVDHGDYDAAEILAGANAANAPVPDRIINDNDCYFRIFALNEDVTYTGASDGASIQRGTVTYEDVMFDLDVLYGVTFTGECDDTFIHSGTMTYQGNTYELRDLGYSSSNLVPISSLLENTIQTAIYVDVARNEQEERLNNEAKALYESIINRIEQTSSVLNNDDLNSRDIFTSHYMVLKTTPSGTVTGFIYIFHPLEMVLRSNIALYVILFVVLVLVEAFVIYMMRKTYKGRQEQEMRSRRLRRGIAHELKTPLAIAKLYMENQEYIDESERPDYSRKVNRELEDMTGLIDALLEMDKIDSGKDMLKPEEFDINSMIKAVYARIKPLADERNLEVKLPEDKEYLVKADIKFMKIAIGNYLTNMVKYADKEAKVTISIHGNAVRVIFANDSTNDKKSNVDKLNSNGMGVEINENIMRLHGFKYGSGMQYNETRFWFEAEKV